MGRDSKAVACLLILLGVALLSLAVPAAGDMRTVIAGGTGGHHSHSIHATMRQLMMTKSTRLEDVVAPELGMNLHQPILGGGDSNSKGLEADKQVCLPKCTDPSEPYTGRDCKKIYRCR